MNYSIKINKTPEMLTTKSYFSLNKSGKRRVRAIEQYKNTLYINKTLAIGVIANKNGLYHVFSDMSNIK
jgi:hypothetical protein